MIASKHGGDVGSLNRVWKYDQGRDFVAAGSSLNHTGYGGFVGSGTMQGLARTNSTQKHLGAHQSHHFLTQSGSKTSIGKQQTMMVGQRSSAQQPKHVVDKSLKAVLSGKNLFNLTQSAAARQGRESYIITGPSQQASQQQKSLHNISADLRSAEYQKNNTVLHIDLTEDSHDRTSAAGARQITMT